MTQTCSAFSGDRLIASGAREAVARAVKTAWDAGEIVLVFDDADGRPIDFDPRVDADLPSALPETATPKRGPGRPRLGVTAREVTLLPRHWDWLASQPGGASVALRKLVEAAMRASAGPDTVRRSREAAYRFMTAMAGDRPGYEEATRMLFAGDWSAFDAATDPWPLDIRTYARRLAELSWRNGSGRDGLS